MATQVENTRRRRDVRRVRRDGTIAPLAFPDLAIAVEDVFA